MCYYKLVSFECLVGEEIMILVKLWKVDGYKNRTKKYTCNTYYT